MKNNRSLRDIPLWKLDSENRVRTRPLVKNLDQKTIFQLMKIQIRARKDLDFELVERVGSVIKDRVGENKTKE